MVEGGSREGVSLSKEAHCRRPRGRAPLLGALSYERKSLGSVEQPGVGSSTGDFERWLKVALEVGHFSLWELCEGNLEGGFPCWGPWRIGRKGSGDGHLFP
jgi:hypothetical protein